MDSYATILFSKITEINPKEFCKQYGLCRDIALFSGVTSDSTCVFCHHLLDEIVSKLKDPDAEVTALCHLYIPYPEFAFLLLTFPIDVCSLRSFKFSLRSAIRLKVMSSRQVVWYTCLTLGPFSTCSTCWGMFGLLLKLPSCSQGALATKLVYMLWPPKCTKVAQRHSKIWLGCQGICGHQIKSLWCKDGMG